MLPLMKILMVFRPGTMRFGISIKKCFRKMDSIQKMMHSASVNAESKKEKTAGEPREKIAKIKKK